jgi:hypothetical protein
VQCPLDWEWLPAIGFKTIHLHLNAKTLTHIRLPFSIQSDKVKSYSKKRESSTTNTELTCRDPWALQNKRNKCSNIRTNKLLNPVLNWVLIKRIIILQLAINKDPVVLRDLWGLQCLGRLRILKCAKSFKNISIVICSKIQPVQASRLTKPPLISLHRATPLLYNMRIRHTHLIQDYSSKEELLPKSNKKCFWKVVKTPERHLNQETEIRCLRTKSKPKVLRIQNFWEITNLWVNLKAVVGLESLVVVIQVKRPSVQSPR